jgi:ureidoacrylate peracid hydrolase
VKGTRAKRPGDVFWFFFSKKNCFLAFPFACLDIVFTQRAETKPMHQINIPDTVVQRVIQRRGKEHIFDDVDPARTALVVVDMQNGFMMPGVAHSLCEEAVNIVPNINKIAETLRAHGGLVVWIQNRFTDESLVSWSVSHEMRGVAGTKKRADAMREGSVGHQLWAGLDVQPEDMKLPKERFSAFIQGSSPIEAVLRSKGIDTVIVTGTVTNVCCESTARDAMMRNFRVIFVSDGNAANNDAEHNATLVAIYLTFGDVMSTDMLVGLLRQNAKSAAA